jgi:hypothetical protein
MVAECRSLFKKGYNFAEHVQKASELAPLEGGKEQALGVMLTQVDYVRTLSAAKSLESFNRKIISILADIGFTDYVLIRKTAVNAIETPHSSLPEALFDEYQQGKYCRHDMVLDYINTETDEPILLSMIEHIIECAPMMTYSFEKNLQILDIYKKFAINDAYVIPVRSQRESGNDRAIFSVMALNVGREEFAKRVKKSSHLLRVLANAVILVSETVFLPALKGGLIKAKPLRLLSTMAQHDLSLAQAADSLCISLDTANKHMALAKQALGTSSQANAVYLAVSKGLISV